MEVSNESIDDLFQVIDSLIRENAQLKNKLQISNRIHRKYLYENLYEDDLNNSNVKIQTVEAIQN